MAERRMFAKSIIDSDLFLDMPMSSQLLYFHLSMRADDDGFINNPKRIQRTVGCSDDDMRVLISKQFILPFDSGVVVIRHWRIHNYIQKDRKKDTLCVEEKSQLTTKKTGEYILANNMDTNCVHDGYIMDTQDSIGKDSIGKVSIDKDSIGEDGNDASADAPKPSKNKSSKKEDIEKVLNEYTDDEETLSLLHDWLDVRKEKKSANTARAIQINLKKLEGCAKNSGMTVKKYLEEVIARGWAAFYDIKQYGGYQAPRTQGKQDYEETEVPW